MKIKIVDAYAVGPDKQNISGQVHEAITNEAKTHYWVCIGEMPWVLDSHKVVEIPEPEESKEDSLKSFINSVGKEVSAIELKFR